MNPTHDPFGHAPMTAAASKALAAGGASREGRPSPFHRALADSTLSYHHWWILTALRVRTAKTAEKLRAAEHAKLRAGLTTNGYGDLVTLLHGHTTKDRCVGKYGITVTKLHGFRKHRRRFFPEKSTHYITSHLLDALVSVLTLAEQFEKQDAQEKAAAKAGFVSVQAHWRYHKRTEAKLDEERRAAFDRGYQRGLRETQENRAAYADLNDYGIAPDRDVISGPSLTLMNFHRSRTWTVSVVDFLNLTGLKNQRRDAGWRLPAWRAPQPDTALKPRSPLFTSHRRIDRSAQKRQSA